MIENAPFAPTTILIVQQLCALPGGPLFNFERDCLDAALDHLTAEPARLAEALVELEEGVNHAFRPNFSEDRPESWLVAAAAELLRREIDAANDCQ